MVAGTMVKKKTEHAVVSSDAFHPDGQWDYRLLRHRPEEGSPTGKPHKHDFFLMLLVREGSGTHSIDFTDYPVTGRQLHLLFPGQVHSWELGENTTGYQLMVGREAFEASSSFLRLSFVLHQSHQVFDLSDETFAALWYELEAMESELAETTVDWDLVQLRGRVALQVAGKEAERLFDDIATYRAYPLLVAYQGLIEKHFGAQKNVAFYADKLNISPNYLNILCKRHLHVPATHLIYNRIILEAKRLLLVSGQSAKEIAFELGFSDLPHFSNFFKAHTGHSPRAFRSTL